jgi:hypothetical protein
MEVTPLPGMMLVELEPLYQKNTGPIITPETVGDAPHLVGKVVKLTVRERDIRHLGYEPKATDRVLLTPGGGFHVENNLYLYPITFQTRVAGKKKTDTFILGLAGDGEFSPVIQDNERCSWCGYCREGSKQAMLMWEGTCPRCHKDRQGAFHEPDNDRTGAYHTPDPTDEEVEEFAEVAGDSNMKRELGIGQKKGTIFSLPSKNR